MSSANNNNSSPQSNNSTGINHTVSNESVDSASPNANANLDTFNFRGLDSATRNDNNNDLLYDDMNVESHPPAENARGRINTSTTHAGRTRSRCKFIVHCCVYVF